jgi:hypothetical protein
VLTASVKVSDASETGFVGINFLDAAGNVIGQGSTAVSTTAYSQARVQASAPANVVSAVAYVWKNAGAGYVYVDDFVLSVAGSAPAPAPSPAPAPAPAPSPSPAPAPAGQAAPTILGDCEMFPSTSIFNTRIDDTTRFPALPNSKTWINLVGSSTPFTGNWGNSSNPANTNDYWGLPINYVDGTSATTNWPVVSFNYSDSGVWNTPSYPEKSDCAVATGSGYTITHDCTTLPPNARRFPFPKSQTLAEGGNCGGPGTCGDHHVLVIEKGACRLWESYYAHNLGGAWYAVSTAAWDLKSNALRPDQWGSADAAGLPITPLLAKASEASTGEIRHALRVTFRDGALDTTHAWPARFGSGGPNAGAIPFGSLLRLRADFVIPDNWDPQAKAIANAAKRYGLYVADNGADFYVQGEPSDGWHPAAWNQLRSISMSDMEFVDLKSITGNPRFDRNSMQASW